jgi:hypothetical protein
MNWLGPLALSDTCEKFRLWPCRCCLYDFSIRVWWFRLSITTMATAHNWLNVIFHPNNDRTVTSNQPLRRKNAVRKPTCKLKSVSGENVCHLKDLFALYIVAFLWQLDLFIM